MKTISTLLTAAALSASLLIATSNANATLIDQGATVYDNDLAISWLKNGNLAASNTFGVSGINAGGFMTWNTAQSWIGAMNTASYLGYSDWRLPTMTDPSATCNTVTYSGGPCGWNNPATSEMAHLFYNELGNKGYFDTAGVGLQPGWGLANTGPFSNVQSDGYWSGTSFAPGTNDAWNFNFHDGSQGNYGKNSIMYALAVRPGQAGATVPEPAGLALFGIGLLGLMAVRRRLALR